MNCPDDDTTLEVRPVHTIQVSECPQCSGRWFESDALRQAKDASDPDLRWLDFDLWSERESLKASWSKRKCPQCGRELMQIAYDGTGVTIDTCQEGHGIWLDKGEFEAIIDALRNEVATKHASQYVGRSLEEVWDLLTGREGLASEWQDLATVTRLMQYRILAEHPKLAELLVALNRTTPIR